MTTELATATHYNLDLEYMRLGQQARLVTAEGHNWYLRRYERRTPEDGYIDGFYVQSDDPTWIQRQGQGFCPIQRIGRYIAEGCTYFIGGFELLVVDVHSVNRRDI